HGHRIGRLAAAVQVQDGVVDRLVRRPVEVVPAEHLDHIGDGVLGHQHAADDALLGGHVLRRSLLEALRSVRDLGDAHPSRPTAITDSSIFAQHLVRTPTPTSSHRQRRLPATRTGTATTTGTHRSGADGSDRTHPRPPSANHPLGTTAPGLWTTCGQGCGPLCTACDLTCGYVRRIRTRTSLGPPTGCGRKLLGGLVDDTPTGRSLDRRILDLAVPALGALVAEPLFILIDSAVVGHLGTAQLAGLTLASTLLVTTVALFIFLAYATTGAVARRLGAGDERGALALGLDGMWLALLLGAALLVLGLAGAEHVVAWMGASAEVAPHAVAYLRSSMPGIPGMLVVLAATGALRGLQDTKTPLRVAVIGAIANAI